MTILIGLPFFIAMTLSVYTYFNEPSFYQGGLGFSLLVFLLNAAVIIIGVSSLVFISHPDDSPSMERKVHLVMTVVSSLFLALFVFL